MSAYTGLQHPVLKQTVSEVIYIKNKKKIKKTANDYSEETLTFGWSVLPAPDRNQSITISGFRRDSYRKIKES